MYNKQLLSTAMVLAAGMGVGLVVSAVWSQASRAATAHAQATAPDATAEIAALKVEIEQIKGKLPGQAHAMIDVAYHFTNLWFAGQRGNWPLAQFNFNEVRSHLRWAVRIIPVRKDSAGREIQLADILQAVENTPLKQLETSIQAKDHTKFVSAYEATLQGCYACHKATEKDYLQLKIPDHPADALLEFSPVSTNSP